MTEHRVSWLGMKAAVEQRVSGGNEFFTAFPLSLIIVSIVDFYLLALGMENIPLILLHAIPSPLSLNIMEMIAVAVDTFLIIISCLMLLGSPWFNYYRSVANSLISDQRDSFLPYTYYLNYKMRATVLIASVVVGLLILTPIYNVLDVSLLLRRSTGVTNIAHPILALLFVVSFAVVSGTSIISLHRSRLAISFIAIFVAIFVVVIGVFSNFNYVVGPISSAAASFVLFLFMFILGPVQLITQYNDHEQIEVVIDGSPTSDAFVDYMPPAIRALHFAPIYFTFDAGGRSAVVLQRTIGSNAFAMIDVLNRGRVPATDRQIKIWNLTALQVQLAGPFAVLDSRSVLRASGLINAIPGRLLTNVNFSQQAISVAGRVLFESNNVMRGTLIARVGTVLSEYTSDRNFIDGLNQLSSFIELALLTIENATSASEVRDVRFDPLNSSFQQRAAQVEEIQAKAKLAGEWFIWLQSFEHDQLPQLASILREKWQDALLLLVAEEGANLSDEEKLQVMDLLNCYSLRLDDAKIEFAGVLLAHSQRLRELRDSLLELQRAGRDRLDSARTTMDERKWEMARAMIGQTGATPQMIEALFGGAANGIQSSNSEAPRVIETAKSPPVDEL